MSDTSHAAGFEAPDPSQLMSLFPGYDVECLIACGGMGAVYRAVQRSLERTVALKILPREFSADAAFCAGFEAEAKAMARLNHPNLIGVYDFGEVDGMLYIIMEYVAGQSLFHSAAGQTIHPSEVVRLISGICAGLAHAHQHGILHRDIKPANILLDVHAEPKIGDFGLARPVDRQVQEGEEIFGTPHYTAPEVVDAPQSVDNRADIFSVGVVLHELLTGKLPADDPRPASVIAGCDPRFDAVIRKATHPSPDGRYTSAAEIAAELQLIATTPGPRVLRTAGSAAAGGRALPIRPRPVQVKQPSRAPAILAVLFIAGLAFAIFTLATRKPADPAASREPDLAIGTGVIDLPPTPAENPPPQPAPEPIALTTPEPEPEPEPALDPEPEPEPDLAMENGDPASDEPIMVDDPFETAPATPVAQPKYDVADFLERARSVMREKAATPVAARNEALAKNTAAFERVLNREIRRLNPRAKERAEIALINASAEWQRDGNRIPTVIDGRLSGLLDISQPHNEALQKQEEIEAAFAAELQQLSETYLLGLDRQRQRLTEDGDPGAAQLIEREITTTREDPVHFPHLMTFDPKAN
jgi:hypothetical protein